MPLSNSAIHVILIVGTVTFVTMTIAAFGSRDQWDFEYYGPRVLDTNRMTEGLAFVDTPPNSGFSVLVLINSLCIAPDITKQHEFRTSQLVVYNGNSWPSRRVLYKSNAARGPDVVLVLPIDAYGEAEFLKRVLRERQLYCKLHNYGLFARYIQDFAAEGKPARESLGLAPLRMLRQAMVAFPEAKWFWLLHAEGHINNMKLPAPATQAGSLSYVLEDDLNTQTVAITNFARDPDNAEIIVTSDPTTGIVSAQSILVKRSLTSRALLEFVCDPMLQDWEPFLRGRDHAGTALTHILRWHPALVKSVGLINSRMGGTQRCAEALDDDVVCMLV